ncbi:MAG TPA: hypothetical protein VJN93_06330 [Candidatus Acidoferrum sp.]|nr:hypothetical protein [Candidatus Acidoferrum sp.]
MPDKEQIVASIQKLARKLRHTPTHWEFTSQTGFTDYVVTEHFAKWNDAIRAAGLQPYARNLRAEDSELLSDWGEVTRKNRAMPAHREYRRTGNYDPRTIERRFGAWSKVPGAFRQFAEGKREWADVLALIPERVKQMREGKRERRAAKHGANAGAPWYAGRKKLPVYGNPTQYRWLRHEPTNEMGVVLLFGMMAKDLGYLIENVQARFPDCEAKRQIGPDRWQRVRIEFEYESRNFREHGHAVQGCDMIVCWRHNWKECPKQLEVIELARVIQTMSG